MKVMVGQRESKQMKRDDLALPEEPATRPELASDALGGNWKEHQEGKPGDDLDAPDCHLLGPRMR
jgi:hypothetical protein